jgi:peptidoglycan/xylan/chitin deacetylase (PgdA/CDA1 family)
LQELPGFGLELGAHGYDHIALPQATPDVLRREVVDARAALENAVGAPADTFAYPYGSVPGDDGVRLVRGTYRAAGTTKPRHAVPADDAALLPRVDAHYLRPAQLFRRVLAGRGDAYLATREALTRLRHLVEGRVSAR